MSLPLDIKNKLFNICRTPTQLALHKYAQRVLDIFCHKDFLPMLLEQPSVPWHSVTLSFHNAGALAED